MSDQRSVRNVRTECEMCNIPSELIIGKLDGVLIAKATTPDGEVIPNHWLLVPAGHIGSLRLLPDSMTAGKWRVLELLEQYWAGSLMVVAEVDPPKGSHYFELAIGLAASDHAFSAISQGVRWNIPTLLDMGGTH